MQQRQLTQRLCAVIQHLHLLIPSVRSSSIRPEEGALKGGLEEIEEEVRRGRLRGKLNELWALIGAVGAAAERERGGGGGGSGGSGGGQGGGGGGEWTVVDEDGLAQLTHIVRAAEWAGALDEDSEARIEGPGCDYGESGKRWF